MFLRSPRSSKPAMPMTRIVTLCGCLLLLAAPVFGQDGTEPIKATDLLKIKQLDDVTVSPDGRHIAYTVREIVEKTEEAGTYEYRTHLHYFSAEDLGAPRQLTFGDRGGSDPAWHPTSDRLAFVRPVDGKPQVFVLPIFGGEAYQLTTMEHGATSPQWSPDGTRLLFASSLPEKAVAERMADARHWPDERPGRHRGDTVGAEPDPDGSLRQVRAWLEKNAGDENPRVFTRLDVQGEHDLAPAFDYRHLFVLEVDAEDAEPVAVTQGYFSFGDAAWLPGGAQILLSGAPVEDRHPDRVRDSDLFIVDAGGGRFTRLLDLDGYSVFAPRPSPDGNLVAFLAQADVQAGYAQTEIGVFAIDGRTPPEMLTLGFDRSAGLPEWSPDNWFLYFVAPSEGGFPLYRLPTHTGRPASAGDPAPAAGDSLAADSLTLRQTRAAFAEGELVRRSPEVEQLTDATQGIRSFSLSRATAYYVVTEAANPFELYASNIEFSQARRLTDHNARWLASKKLSLPEAATLERDTLRIQYWVMPPTFAERGEKYPLLLEIHGGPSAMWGPGEATMWHEFQFMAARGFGVVYSNPRGSGGYGYAFKHLNYRDWGTGPAGDVLEVAREAVRKNRWADEDRQVVTGGSYAGYLTAWIVAHDDRFQAAVAQRGVYDLTAFLGEGNAWRLVPWHFGGYPWDDEGEDAPYAVLRANSPLTFVDQIETPLLIIHSDNDLRTGVTQSENLYKSLKILEKPVEYVRYPNAGHDLSRTGDPRQRVDRTLRIYEFLARYVTHDAAEEAAEHAGMN